MANNFSKLFQFTRFLLVSFVVVEEERCVTSLKTAVPIAIISESRHLHRHDPTGNDDTRRSAENYHFRLILTAVDCNERLIKYW